jgi:hypothetical protein
MKILKTIIGLGAFCALATLGVFSTWLVSDIELEGDIIDLQEGVR